MNTTQTSRGRGQGRARGPSNRPPRSNYTSHTHTQAHNASDTRTSVPRISLLHPGTPVSIVLKCDQRSGREVQGFVGELLTRGDHPRGVKVRLGDGRVGRVQRIVSEVEAEDVSRGLEGLGENGEVRGGGIGGRGRGRGRGGSFLDRRYTDFRNDGYEESAAGNHSVGASLEDYIVVKDKRKGKGKGGAKVGDSVGNQDEVSDGEDAGELSQVGEREVFKSEMSVCPVCGKFEGDEMAVAHHVNGHFE